MLLHDARSFHHTNEPKLRSIKGQYMVPESGPIAVIDLLSQEARELLIEAAADNSGQVLKLQFLSGSHIQTNHKTFGKDLGPRAWVRWEAALEQLVDNGLLKHVATTSGASTYKMTTQGYDLADRLR
jgi:hypothetical protein